MQKKKTFTGFVFRPPFLVLLLRLPPPSLGEGLGEAPPRSRRTGPGSRRRAAGPPANERPRPPREGALRSSTAPSSAPVPGAWGRAFSDSGGVRRSPPSTLGVAGELKGLAPPDPGRPARLGRGRRAPGARPRFGRGSPGGKTRWFEKVAGVACGEGGEGLACETAQEPGVLAIRWKVAGALGRLAETPGWLTTHPSRSLPSRDGLAEGAGDTGRPCCRAGLVGVPHPRTPR